MTLYYRTYHLISFLILIFLWLFHFPPHNSPNLSHAYLPPLILPLFGFVCVSFIVVPGNPSPFYPIIPSCVLSGYCECVLNFYVSGYILLACLFCWLGSMHRWDHIVFPNTSEMYFIQILKLIHIYGTNIGNYIQKLKN